MSELTPLAGTLGARIKQLRTEAGMSKAVLARKVGVSDVTVSYWESGEIEQVGHQRLMALAVTFGCTVSELLGDPMQSVRDARVETEAVREFAGEVWDALLATQRTHKVLPLTMAKEWGERRQAGGAA